MNHLYHAYQTYERRIIRGELDKVPAAPHVHQSPIRPPLAYRLGERLVRIGLKLQRQTLAGHTLTSTTMAEK
jgi:hypothetical protein